MAPGTRTTAGADGHARAIRTDPEVVAAARRGSSDAFATLHALTEQRVRSAVRRLVRDSQDAEDAVQETFLAVFRALPRLADVGAFDGWMLRIARNAAINSLRKTGRERPSLRAHDETMDGAPGMPRVVRRSGSQPPCPRASALLSAALDEMPSAVRETLRHRYEHGLSCAEIADRLGVTQSCVKTRLFRARRALRGTLGPDA